MGTQFKTVVKFHGDLEIEHDCPLNQRMLEKLLHISVTRIEEVGIVCRSSSMSVDELIIEMPGFGKVENI